MYGGRIALVSLAFFTKSVKFFSDRQRFDTEPTSVAEKVWTVAMPTTC
jgi:hypothetical protein